MKVYDVLVGSLHPRLESINKRWVRGVVATTLTDASRKAQATHPNLGVTPTTTYMCWAVYPQPKGESK